MSSAPAKTDKTADTTADKTAETAAPPKGSRKKLIVLAVPVVLGVIGAGLWFGGILPPLLGMGHKAADAKAAAKAVEIAPPSFVAVPELVANLDAGAGQTSYIKLDARLELAKAADQTVVEADMPRVVDMFQTYLRDMRPEELRSSSGTYRLREELIGRANVAVRPARVVDVLFTQILIQ
jgi:flagellar FliL protein